MRQLGLYSTTAEEAIKKVTGKSSEIDTEQIKKENLEQLSNHSNIWDLRFWKKEKDRKEVEDWVAGDCKESKSPECYEIEDIFITLKELVVPRREIVDAIMKNDNISFREHQGACLPGGKWYGDGLPTKLLWEEYLQYMIDWHSDILECKDDIFETEKGFAWVIHEKVIPPDKMAKIHIFYAVQTQPENERKREETILKMVGLKKEDITCEAIEHDIHFKPEAFLYDKPWEHCGGFSDWVGESLDGYYQEFGWGSGGFMRSITVMCYIRESDGSISIYSIDFVQREFSNDDISKAIPEVILKYLKKARRSKAGVKDG